MTGKNHVWLGLLAGALSAYTIGGDIKEVIIPVTVGSLWPDTDTRKSILGRFIPLWMARGIAHRGFTHSHAAAFIFSLAWDRLFHGGLWFLIGYLSHIWVDLGISFIKKVVKKCLLKRNSWKPNES